MSYTNNLVLDLNAQPNGVYIYSKEGDSLSRFLNVTILRDGVKYTPTESVMFRAQKPDGHAVITAGTVEDDGTVTVEITAQTLAVAGRILCDIALVDDDGVVSTATFTIIANHMPNVADQAESSDEFGYIIEMLNDFRTAVETSVDEYVAEYSGGFATKVELESVQDTVTEQSAVIAEQQRVNDRQNKQIDTLYKILDGQELDFDTQTQTAYELPIESAKGKVMGAGALDMLGGMSQVIDGEIRTAQTSAIVSEGRNMADWSKASHEVYSYGDGILKTQSNYQGIARKFATKGQKVNLSFTANSKLTANKWCAITLYDENGNYLRNVSAYAEKLSVTPNANEKLASFVLYGQANIPSDAFEQVMFYLGDALDAYIPYKETSVTIPQDCPVLHGINDSVYDYLEFADDKVLLHKRVGVASFDGTEPWSNGGAADNRFRVYINRSDVTNKTTGINGVCDKVNVREYQSRYDGSIDACFVGGGTIQFMVVATDVSTAKSWIENNTPTVIYELATEQILDVTDIFKTFDNLITVEDGGTLTFKNSAENESLGIHIPVPSTETYAVRLGV